MHGGRLALATAHVPGWALRQCTCSCWCMALQPFQAAGFAIQASTAPFFKVQQVLLCFLVLTRAANFLKRSSRVAAWFRQQQRRASRMAGQTQQQSSQGSW